MQLNVGDWKKMNIGTYRDGIDCLKIRQRANWFINYEQK